MHEIPGILKLVLEFYKLNKVSITCHAKAGAATARVIFSKKETSNGPEEHA